MWSLVCLEKKIYGFYFDLLIFLATNIFSFHSVLCLICTLLCKIGYVEFKCPFRAVLWTEYLSLMTLFWMIFVPCGVWSWWARVLILKHSIATLAPHNTGWVMNSIDFSHVHTHLLVTCASKFKPLKEISSLLIKTFTSIFSLVLPFFEF